MPDASTLLQDANACHDDDPQRAATLLGQVDANAMQTDEQPLYAFLLNHVLGERLGQWAQAHAALQALHTSRAPVVLRQAAVAAQLAGEHAAAAACTQALALACGGAASSAAELVHLASAAFSTPAQGAAAAGQAVLAALQPLHGPAWQTTTPFDAAAAAQCNNLAAALSERGLPDYAEPALCGALLLAAERSQFLWQRAGSWVQRERAHYGRAVALNTVKLSAAAAEQAEAGLALLDANDRANEESVDRAFLHLERAHALDAQGLGADAAHAQAQAQALAALFNDAGLSRWFAQRQARHEALLRSSANP